MYYVTYGMDGTYLGKEEQKPKDCLRLEIHGLTSLVVQHRGGLRRTFLSTRSKEDSPAVLFLSTPTPKETLLHIPVYD